MSESKPMCFVCKIPRFVWKDSQGKLYCDDCKAERVNEDYHYRGVEEALE